MPGLGKLRRQNPRNAPAKSTFVARIDTDKENHKGHKGHQGKAFVSVAFVSFVFFVVLFIRVHSVFNPWQIEQVIYVRILSTGLRRRAKFYSRSPIN